MAVIVYNTLQWTESILLPNAVICNMIPLTLLVHIFPCRSFSYYLLCMYHVYALLMFKYLEMIFYPFVHFSTVYHSRLIKKACECEERKNVSQHVPFISYYMLNQFPNLIMGFSVTS